MTTHTQLVAYSTALGIGATVIMDLWAALQRRLFGVRTLDYALVGRWLGHLAHGQVSHQMIASSPPVAGERLIGWIAHYMTGVAFAACLLVIWGIEWVRDPSLAPALVLGLATIVFPFFVLQPAFGAGIAASRTPHPNVARARSVVTHLVFGIGLYVSAFLIGRV